LKNSADIRICIKHYGCLWNFCFGPSPNRHDLGYEIGSRLTRNRSREVWLKGEIGRNWLRSNAPGNDYTGSCSARIRRGIGRTLIDLPALR